MKVKRLTDLIFQRIEHGDAEHRKWLKDKLEKMWPELADFVYPTDIRESGFIWTYPEKAIAKNWHKIKNMIRPNNLNKESNVSPVWLDVDVEIDPPN